MCEYFHNNSFLFALAFEIRSLATFPLTRCKCAAAKCKCTRRFAHSTHSKRMRLAQTIRMCRSGAMYNRNVHLYCIHYSQSHEIEEKKIGARVIDHGILIWSLLSWCAVALAHNSGNFSLFDLSGGLASFSRAFRKWQKMHKNDNNIKHIKSIDWYFTENTQTEFNWM